MSDKNSNRTVPREGPLVSSASRPAAGPSRPTAGLSRPLVGSSMFGLGTTVTDISASMLGSIGELNAAVADLASVLADPANRGGFHLASVAYADTARLLVAPKPATDVRPDELVVSAGMLGDCTNMTAGIQTALDAIEAHASAPGRWARPVVVLMTDGCPNLGGSPETIAARLKTKADLVCLAFGPAADLSLLQRLANTPGHAFKATTGADLRRFFAQVGRTMSQAARTGQSAAALLGGSGVLRG